MDPQENMPALSGSRAADSSPEPKADQETNQKRFSRGDKWEIVPQTIHAQFQIPQSDRIIRNS